MFYGWSSLDVYVVSVVAAATQFGEVAGSLAKDDCAAVDGFLAAFLDEALDGDASCFGLAVDVLPGCLLLTFACLAHMVLGHLAGNVTIAIVAERAAELSRTGPDPATRELELVALAQELELVALKEGMEV